MSRRLKHILVWCLVPGLGAQICCPLVAAAQGAQARPPLQGGVSQDILFEPQPAPESVRPQEPPLDPFPESVALPPVEQQPPADGATGDQPPEFGLSAEEGAFAGQPGEALPDTLPGRLSPAVPDPDSTPEMQLLWDAWHRRVAQNIFSRFNFFARSAFRHSRPLVSRVRYIVTNGGQIRDVQVLQASPNLFFNLLIVQVVKSLNGDLGLLQFPPGSRRQFVEKMGVFTQNLGAPGFKYTVGDTEKISG